MGDEVHIWHWGRIRENWEVQHHWMGEGVGLQWNGRKERLQRRQEDKYRKLKGIDFLESSKNTKVCSPRLGTLPHE